MDRVPCPRTDGESVLRVGDVQQYTRLTKQFTFSVDAVYIPSVRDACAFHRQQSLENSKVINEGEIEHVTEG